MKPTVTLSWKSFGFAGMVAIGALLAIMPTRLAGASLETRLADVAATMPSEGYAVSATTLADWLSGGKPLTLLDVREHWEFDEFHIEGSEHESATALVATARIKALAADRPIVVVGRGDAAAAQSAALLRLAGREAFVLEGGLAAWWSDVLSPASIAAGVPAAERPSLAAKRFAWRARFLGTAGAAPETGVAAARPAPAAPKAAPQKPAGQRGKGC
jgi:rhodanese-related sulfurtransferase